MSGQDFRGMEHFAADNDPPLAVALHALGECEVYVGIIGARYGSSPPDHDLSFTEVEYNRATELGTYRIMLVSRGGLSQDELPERLERLKQFRARVMAAHTVQRFRNPHEAAMMVLAALMVRQRKLLEEGQQ